MSTTTRGFDENAVAREYRAERGQVGGYVIFYLGEPCGWRKDLSEADGWLPGCIALDEQGQRYGAMGGSDYSGAERWERLA